MLHTEPTIVIVDDDAEDRGLLIDALLDAGMRNTVVQYDNGAAFLSALGTPAFATVPKVVILDLYMPNMSGYAVLEAISMCRPRLLFPVIVLSDNCSEEADVERTTRLGAMECYPKPNYYRDYKIIVAAIKHCIAYLLNR